jgi:GST-like protein
MIDLYYWPTPNGKKISIMLEECGLPYKLRAVNIGRGEQFDAEFLRISPNNRMPAIVDIETGISVFESGAILQYLAEKSGQFMPGEMAPRYEVLQWLYWQMGGLGPMAGQLSHFVNYAPEPNPYALDRYRNEYDRLLGVMNKRLADRAFLAGDYSIADMASFPWVAGYKRFGTDLDGFGQLRRWFDGLKSRPAVRRGMEAGENWPRDPLTDEEARKILFGQTGQTVAAAGSNKSSKETA